MGKLTNEARDRIIKEVTTKKLSEEINAVQAEIADFFESGIAAFCRDFQDMIDANENHGGYVLAMAQKFYYYTSDYTYIRHDAAEKVFIPFCWYNGNSEARLRSGRKHVDHYFDTFKASELFAKRQCAEKERDENRRIISGVLKSITTTKKLIEVLPEIQAYIPQDILMDTALPMIIPDKARMILQ
jgi:hypothetical protein